MPKRVAPASSNPSKKRKIAAKSHAAQKNKRNEKLAAKDTIPIPDNDDRDVDLSDQDHTFLEEYGDAVSFLRDLDRKGIARSKHEVERLHRLNNPPIRTSTLDDLPSIQSSDEGTDNSSDSPSDLEDVEEIYERATRKHASHERFSERHVIERLPIKLSDGRLIKTGVRDLPDSDDTTEDEIGRLESDDDRPTYKVEDVSTGARFGRPAVLNVIGQPVRKHRIKDAKEQIASICQEIIADPENSLGLLKRLHTFSQNEISSVNHPTPISNDPVIRKLTILSQLAVFTDIIPGYRIRELTAKEAAEKVSQEVARLREWEQGLVRAYQNYLRCLEAELKSRSELAETALKCMCTLLADATHFNFRINLMTCIVGQLSRRSWTKISDMCLNTIKSVFSADTTGEPSLEIVRILNRMIRERRFQIHPNVLACLLNLRLKSELNVRASETKADNAAVSRSKKHTKGKAADQPHLSKKAKKALKERKEIEKEFREAAAEVDKEKRAATQTETLKLLFTIYFRVLKSPTPTPLLPAALHGIAKFAHLVNVDFFKDLMAVLKSLLSFDSKGDKETPDKKDVIDRLHMRLLCIVTAFKLLSGQGEALNVDLNDFVTRLYGLVLPLSLIPDIDVPCSSGSLNIADLLFDALGFVFSPRSFGATPPPWRSAAFSKRLLTASLSWPPLTTLRALQFVGTLISKEPKLDALLSTDDQIYDGVYQPDVDDPQLCHPFGTCFWELQALRNHWDARIRAEANKLCQISRP